MTDDGEMIPALGDVVEYSDQEHDDRRWILLYDEDYEDLIIDLDDTVGILVESHQAGEILELAAKVLADLSHKDADGGDVIDDMIDALEAISDD